MSQNTLVLKHKKKKLKVIAYILWAVYFYVLCVRNEKFLKSLNDYILLFLSLILFRTFVFLLTVKLVLNKDTGEICFQKFFRKFKFNVKDIKKIEYLKYQDSDSDPLPFQACEITHGENLKLVQIPYDTFDETQFKSFIDYIKEKRSDLGDFDKNIYKIPTI